MAPTLKEKVIQAAVDYIAEFGPDGLSFRRIAADAGVSHQAPYHHFGDRDAIFAEIGLLGFRKFVAEMTAAARRDEDADPLTRMLERYVQFALTNKGYFRVMFRSDLCNMSDSAELQQAGDEAFGTLIDLVTTTIGNSSSLDEVRVTATSLWSVAHGLATLLIDGPLETKIGTVRDRRALVRAVAKQTQSGLSNL